MNDPTNATTSIGRWLDALNEIMASPKTVGPFADFATNARDRSELIDALRHIPEDLKRLYIEAYEWLFTRLYPEVDESETWFGRQFRDLRAIIETLDDEQIDQLCELPEGHLEHDPSQRFTGQGKKVVRPSGYMTFGEFVEHARDLQSGSTPE